MKIKTRRVGKLSLTTITNGGSFGILYIVSWAGQTLCGGGLGSKQFKGEVLRARAAHVWCDI